MAEGVAVPGGTVSQQPEHSPPSQQEIVKNTTPVPHARYTLGGAPVIGSSAVSVSVIGAGLIKIIDHVAAVQRWSTDTRSWFLSLVPLVVAALSSIATFYVKRIADGAPSRAWGKEWKRARARCRVALRDLDRSRAAATTDEGKRAWQAAKATWEEKLVIYTASEFPNRPWSQHGGAK
jgi:hypothetical protein